MSLLSIVVVDDDRSFLDAMKAMLKRIGFQNIYAYDNVEDAWSHIQRDAPSLIISDWNMDPINGYEFLLMIKFEEHSRNIPFIMNTANMAEDCWVKAIGAGADDFLVKPFSYADLKETIEIALGKILKEDSRKSHLRLVS
jgi:two-component system, chemotaxis family, chemotaxis protein CheY